MNNQIGLYAFILMHLSNKHECTINIVQKQWVLE
jgi:hypothetical protein